MTALEYIEFLTMVVLAVLSWCFYFGRVDIVVCDVEDTPLVVLYSWGMLWQKLTCRKE